MTAQPATESTPEPSSPDAMPEALLAAGLARREAGDTAAAESLFRRALAAQPDDPTSLYLLGLLRFELGDAAEAQALIERLAELKPGHIQALYTLASIRHWRDDRAGAVAAYRRLLVIEPAHVAALTGLSRALAESGDHDGALAPAEAAVAVAPDDATAQMALAATWRGQGEVRKAADAFTEVVRLAPEAVSAHVGLALALSDLGEASEAHDWALRAVALSPGLPDAWLALGAALRGVHEPKAAATAFERALTLDPNRAVAHLNLGLAYIELERAQEARAHLARCLELDPTSAKAHANLSSLYMLAKRPEQAKAHALRALEIEPEMMSPHQNLAALLAEEQRWDEAKVHRDRAYAERCLLISVAAKPEARVLVLTTTESGNTPDRHLIPPARYSRLLWFIEYAGERQMAELPAYDIAFNAIGDEDLAGPTTANASRFAELCPTRLLNPPHLIARTRRDLAEALFGGIPGLVVPRTVRIEAADLADGLPQAAERAGMTGAYLVRPIGSHGGKGLQLIVGGAADAAVAPAMAYYLTQFHDFAAADGLYRKYRVVFVDGEPLPYHAAVADNWMVHYETSGTDLHPERMAEEMRFLDDPTAALGAEAWRAVGEIGAAMGLDYAGVDFSLLPDGRVLLFEANATMLVHPEAAEGPLARKNPAIERIFEAFRAMLAKPA